MERRWNNKGITLLEVIVVVAIIAAITGITTVAFGIVNAVTASSCANSLDASLETVKTEALSKKTVPYLVLYPNEEDGESGFYVATTMSPESFTKTPGAGNHIADSNMVITLEFQDGTTLDATESTVFFTFNRASGAMQKCLIKKEDGSIEEKDYITSIIIAGKGRESKIHIVAETGKHYVE